MAVERAQQRPYTPESTLVLHGQPRFVAQEGVSTALERKDAGLLAYLALEGPTQRARLAALLWPDVDEEKARTNLRQRLARLRKAVGEVVIDQKGALALSPRISVETDGTVRSPEVLTLGADLLSTLDYDDCPAFSEWLNGQRTARRNAARTAIIAEATRVRDSAPDRALALAQSLLTMEPESEEAYRLVMELFYLRSDVGSARAAYDKCREMLRRVYGVAPSAATEALANYLWSTTEPKTVRPLTKIPLTLLRPPRLVGRAPALAAARSALAARHTLVIAGEAGIGKTRLLEELLSETPATTLHFRARPSDTVQTWGALARFCQQLHGAFRLTAADAETRREMARLIPDLGPAPEPISSQAELEGLHRAVCAIVDACHVQCGGLLVAFDDLQFADVATVDSLRALVRPEAGHRGEAASFIIVTRAEGGTWQAKDLIVALDASACTDAVVLQALQLADTRTLLTDLDLGDARWPRLAEQLHRHCGGNPAFLLESVKAMISGESSELTEAGLPIPASVQAALSQRLTRLDETARSLAELAAVAGGIFSLDLASHVLALPRIALAPALRELEAAQVMRGDVFVHDLVEDAVLRSIPDTRRQRLHLQVASLLQRGGEAPGLIAHHLVAAGDEPSALPHMRAAVRLAQTSQRPDEAARVLEEVARIELASGNREAGANALAECFSMYMTTSFVDDANRVLERWSSVAETPAERLQLHSQLAQQQTGFKYLDEALRHAQAAVAIIDADQTQLDAASLAEAFAYVAPAFINSARAEQALTLAKSILSRLDLTDADVELVYLRGLAQALYATGEHATAIEALQRAVQLHTSGADPLTEWDTRTKLARYLIGTGRSDIAADEAKRAIAVGQRQPHFPTSTSNAHYTRAIALLALGEYREALHYFVSRRDYFLRTRWRFSDDIGCRIAVTYLRLGRPDLARAALPKTLDASRTLASDVALYSIANAQVARAVGQSLLPHLLPILQGRYRFDKEEPVLQARLLAAAESAPAEAVVETRSILDRAETLGLTPVMRAAAISAARAEWVAGDAKRAADYVRQALAHTQYCDADYDYLPDVWLAGFEIFEAAGDDNAARDCLQQGVAWVERVAREHVPDEFRESFRARNLVNRKLLAAAARLKMPQRIL